MRYRYLIIAMLLLVAAVTVGAQTANVIELEPADTARAQKAWDALQKAQEKWDTLQVELGQKYTLVKTDDPNAGNLWVWTGPPNTLNTIGCTDNTTNCFTKGDLEQMKRDEDAYRRTHRKGFESGFEFSKDFKYIVPKPASSSHATNIFTHCSGATCW